VSGQNVDTVRSVLEQWRTGATEEILRHWEPDADYYPVRKFPEARPCHGLDEIGQFFDGFADGWETFEFVPFSVIPVGDDKVFVQATIKAVARDTSLALEGDLFHSIWLRHDRILRWEDHLTEAGAVRALGLEGSTIESALD
jgi:hypothetical protein